MSAASGMMAVTALPITSGSIWAMGVPLQKIHSTGRD